MTIEPLLESQGAAARTACGGWRRLRQIVTGSALVALVPVFTGCGEHDELPDTTKQAVTFEDVPENLRAVASKAIPGIKFNEAWKNIERGGKLHSYEIRGTNPADGKTREVRVSVSGEILEME